MNASSVLTDKVILAVDDETDVLDTIDELLEGCILHKASTKFEAKQYLASYTYDVVILDIMGVGGFELLKIAAQRGFPTVMFTANAITPEALEKSIKLGAVTFLPKEKLSDLKEFIVEVLLDGGKPLWGKLIKKLGDYFHKRFGSDWEKTRRLIEELENEMLNNTK